MSHAPDEPCPPPRPAPDPGLAGRLDPAWVPELGPADRARGYVLAPRDRLRTARPRDVAALLPGTFAKLGLAPVPFTRPSALETLWVKVVRRDGDELVGAVDNDPELFPRDVLELGNLVRFRPEHAIVARFHTKPPRPLKHDCRTCGLDDEELAKALAGVRMLDAKLRVLSDIRDFGWHVVLVWATDDRPAFAYTVGLLHTYGHPELIVSGLQDDLLGDLLNRLGFDVAQGRRLDQEPTRDDLLEGLRGELRPASPEVRDDFGLCWWHYGSDFPALELVFP